MTLIPVDEPIAEPVSIPILEENVRTQLKALFDTDEALVNHNTSVKSLRQPTL